MTTQLSYTPAFRDLIKDPAVVEEFDRLSAHLKRLTSTRGAEEKLDATLESGNRPFTDTEIAAPATPSELAVPVASIEPDDWVPGYARRNWYGWRADGAVGSPLFGLGMSNPTTAGPGGTQVNNQADTTYSKYITSGGAASQSGLSWTAAGSCQVRHDPTWFCIMRTGPIITTTRLWFGLNDATLTNADNHGGTTKYVMLRYSTVAADPGWVGVARDGTTQSVTGLVAAIAADTRYFLKIRIGLTGTTAYFSVNGGAEVALSTNLPAAATTLGHSAGLIQTAVAAALEVSLSRCFCQYDVGLPYTGVAPPAVPTASPPLAAINPSPAESVINYITNNITNIAGGGACWRLFKSADQTIAGLTKTALTWDRIAENSDNLFISGGSQVRILVPGIYVLVLRLTSDTALWGIDAENILAGINVNGVAVAQARATVTWIGRLGGGEVIEAWAIILGTGTAKVVSSSAMGFEGYQLKGLS